MLWDSHAETAFHNVATHENRLFVGHAEKDWYPNPIPDVSVEGDPVYEHPRTKTYTDWNLLTPREYGILIERFHEGMKEILREKEKDAERDSSCADN